MLLFLLFSLKGFKKKKKKNGFCFWGWVKEIRVVGIRAQLICCTIEKK